LRSGGRPRTLVARLVRDSLSVYPANLSRSIGGVLVSSKGQFWRAQFHTYLDRLDRDVLVLTESLRLLLRAAPTPAGLGRPSCWLAFLEHRSQPRFQRLGIRSARLDSLDSHILLCLRARVGCSRLARSFAPSPSPLEPGPQTDTYETQTVSTKKLNL
jgi:hypothetical protein